MEYGEIIGAVQHVASCAGSLRLVNCVGADRAQSFERQVRETLDLLEGTDAVTVPQAIALVCQLALDCIGLTNAVDLELASHMTECFDQSLVVWGFSVELARAIAMSLAAVAGLLSLGSHDMSIPSHRYAKRAQIAPYLEPVAADFDMISMQVYGALCRFEAEASSEEERQLQSSFQLICVWILTILSRFEGGRLEPASLWEWANGDPQWALVLSKGVLSSSSESSEDLPHELPELKNAVLLALCGLPSPDIAFGGELEADVIADDLGVIGCFSMQERLVGLDLHRSRLALAACDSSLLKPLLDHAEVSSQKTECVKALVAFVAALAKPVQSQAGAWADVIAEVNTDTGISNQADAAGVIDAFVAEAAGYDRSLWALVFGLAPEDLELRWLSEMALLSALLPPPALEASEALASWLSASSSPSRANRSSPSWTAIWVAFAAGAGLEPEESHEGARELRSVLSRLADRERAQVTQHLARSRAPVRRPETWERWYSCVGASAAATSDIPAPPPPPPPSVQPVPAVPAAPTPPASNKASIAKPSGNPSLRERLRDAPAELCCRLDGKLLVDPVRSPAGHVFERTNLAKALQSTGGLCPLTSEPLCLEECPRAAEVRLQATQWVRSAGRGQR
ncbi:unnamed protein product [Symbiodinium sp. CCMP2456]|nr:unnamed protein product [Symbiodinium sp. CCMP2456]